MRLIFLIVAVCVVYVLLSWLAPRVADAVVVPCIALIVAPAIYHDRVRERERRAGVQRMTVAQ